MFSKKGVIVISKEEYEDEEKLMEELMEVDAEDFVIEENVYEIYTAPENFSSVREFLESKGYEFLSAEVEQVPSNYITLTDEDQIKNMNKLLEVLEDNDDVQNTYHNWNDEV